MSRETYKIVASSGHREVIEYVGAASMNQALEAAKQIFPHATTTVGLASVEEINALFRAHSFDASDLDD